MNLRKCLLATTALIFGIVSRAKPYDAYRDELLSTLPKTHPRLFITPEILERMKKDSESNPLIQNGVKRLYEIVDGYPDVITEETYKDAFYGHDKFGDPAARAALAFLLSGNQAYAIKGIAILRVAAHWYNLRYAQGLPIAGPRSPGCPRSALMIGFTIK